jgi:hypothetical protein
VPEEYGGKANVYILRGCAQTIWSHLCNTNKKNGATFLLFPCLPNTSTTHVAYININYHHHQHQHQMMMPTSMSTPILPTPTPVTNANTSLYSPPPIPAGFLGMNDRF